MTPSVQQLAEFAVQLAELAGEITLRYFTDDNLTVETKADHSPVTVADRHAEAAMRAAILQRFPDDGIVGEEHGTVGGTSGRTWVLDPIDGTKSFIHRVPLFTTLIACEDRDGPAVGVIAAPALDQIMWAGRELGCWQNDVRCHVSQTSDLNDAYVMTSGLEWWPRERAERFVTAPFTVRTWGDGYGFSLVASGAVDAMIDGASLWDFAPLPVIMTEAGGTWTELPEFAEESAVWAMASNGQIDDAVRAAVT